MTILGTGANELGTDSSLGEAYQTSVLNSCVSQGRICPKNQNRNRTKMLGGKKILTRYYGLNHTPKRSLSQELRTVFLNFSPEKSLMTAWPKQNKDFACFAGPCQNAWLRCLPATIRRCMAGGIQSSRASCTLFSDFTHSPPQLGHAVK